MPAPEIAGAEATTTTPARAPLGLWMATALVIGSMIGSGVFLLPAALDVEEPEGLPGLGEAAGHAAWPEPRGEESGAGTAGGVVSMAILLHCRPGDQADAAPSLARDRRSVERRLCRRCQPSRQGGRRLAMLRPALPVPKRPANGGA